MQRKTLKTNNYLLYSINGRTAKLNIENKNKTKQRKNKFWFCKYIGVIELLKKSHCLIKITNLLKKKKNKTSTDGGQLLRLHLPWISNKFILWRILFFSLLFSNGKKCYSSNQAAVVTFIYMPKQWKFFPWQMLFSTDDQYKNIFFFIFANRLWVVFLYRVHAKARMSFFFFVCCFC